MHQHKTDSIRIMNKKSSSSSSTSTILSIVIILTTSVVASSALISFPNIQSNNTRGVGGVSGGGFASTVSKEESTIEMTGSGIRSKGQQIISSTAPNLSQMKSAKSNRSNIIRWAVHGVATELFHNIFLRTFHHFHTRLFPRTGRRILQSDKSRTINMRQPPRHEIAVVTGATGGIGSQIAHELAYRGYDVVIAARDIVKGEALSAKIRELMKVMPIIDTAGKQSCSTSADEKKVPTITFVEYHADVPQSAMNVASSVKELGSPMSILINNAGIMGQSKRLTMRVNLLG